MYFCWYLYVVNEDREGEGGMKDSFSFDCEVFDLRSEDEVVGAFWVVGGRRDIVIERENETILLIASWRGIGSWWMRCGWVRG